MSTRSISLRLKTSLLDRLEARSRETGESRSRLAQRLIEEGLRMDAYPGIVFRDGPLGRRAAVPHGPDVWQIIPVIQSAEETGDAATEAAARYFELPADLIRAAVRYYADFRDEIDFWIRRNDEIAARAEAEWLREREALAR